MNADKKSILEAVFDTDDPKGGQSLNAISGTVIGCAFKVANTLGCGFLEKVYENALSFELRKAGLSVAQQKEIDVRYEGVVVGKYAADLLVDDQILVELKACRDLNDTHRAQCMNYLRATGLKLCLLINFGNPRVEVKRIIL